MGIQIPGCTARRGRHVGRLTFARRFRNSPRGRLADLFFNDSSRFPGLTWVCRVMREISQTKRHELVVTNPDHLYRKPVRATLFGTVCAGFHLGFRTV